MMHLILILVLLATPLSTAFAAKNDPVLDDSAKVEETTIKAEEAEVPAPASTSEGGMPSPEQSATEPAPLPEAPPPVLYEGVVTRVRDVDVIEIDGERMRLLGVSGPARWWWNEPRDCYSMESASFLEELILNKTVGYAYDRATGPDNKRGFRRVYVYLDGKLINEEPIAQGQAFAERAVDYGQKGHFLELEALASLHQIGLWHTCPVECARHEACRVKNW